MSQVGVMQNTAYTPANAAAGMSTTPFGTTAAAGVMRGLQQPGAASGVPAAEAGEGGGTEGTVEEGGTQEGGDGGQPELGRGRPSRRRRE